MCKLTSTDHSRPSTTMAPFSEARLRGLFAELLVRADSVEYSYLPHRTSQRAPLVYLTSSLTEEPSDRIHPPFEGPSYPKKCELPRK
jgi:hypothetical protein